MSLMEYIDCKKQIRFSFMVRKAVRLARRIATTLKPSILKKSESKKFYCIYCFKQYGSKTQHFASCRARKVIRQIH